MRQDVFLSYSRIDLPFVEKLDAFLTDVGVITSFDKKSLLPGQKWEDIIDDEIPQSRTFLTCLSRAGMDRRGYFHTEQHLASEAALRIPPEQLFILPVALGDCEIPRRFRQYQTANLAEPGAIEMLLRALSSALGQEIIAPSDSVENLRAALLTHLGAEGSTNQQFVERFMDTDELSFQDSIGLIETIANSNDPLRLSILLNLRAKDFVSYAEQAALDKAISNVRASRQTENLQTTIRADEMTRILQMSIHGNSEATQLLQINKYFRYISRKNTEAYKMAEEKIHNLLAGRD